MKNISIYSLITLLLFCSPSHAENKKEWNKHKSRHFLIYYDEAPLDFVESVAEMAERYYNEITKTLGFTRYKGWTWDDRAKIYIYNDQEHYVQNSRMMHWSSGTASTRAKIIRTFPAAHGFFDSTLPHELGHIILREFVGFKARLPQWFEEGVAMYVEIAKRWGANEDVKKAIEEGRFIPLSQLTHTRLTSRSDKDLIDLYYAESASVIYYLIEELGEYRFVQFCRKLEKGGPFDWALESSYVRFKTVEDLNEAWVNYLTK